MRDAHLKNSPKIVACLTISVLHLIAAALFSGCEQSSMADWGPAVAVAAGASTVDGDLPDTPPKPKPGDVCPNCNGRGKVGDGTIETRCVPCDGTGRVQAEFPEPATVAEKVVEKIVYRSTPIEWTRWRLPDGSITWGPCAECREAYSSFARAVVEPIRERVESARQPLTGREHSGLLNPRRRMGSCPNGACP